jgi:hypothetical protein
MTDIAHHLEPVYFRAPNAVTGQILASHMYRTREIFSPHAEVVGSLEVTDEILKRVNDFGQRPRYEESANGSATAWVSPEGKVDKVLFSERASVDRSSEFVSQFEPQVRSFVEIGEADRREFLGEPTNPSKRRSNRPFLGQTKTSITSLAALCTRRRQRRKP